MKKYLSQETENKLNIILGRLFQMNSFCDNIAYGLDCELKCQLASNVYHQKFAHAFPSDSFADKLSEVMVKTNLRPVRYGLKDNIKIYENIIEAFGENVKEMENLRELICKTIEDLDYDYNNKNIVMVLEEILLSAQDLLKQSYIWEEKAEEYYNKDEMREFNNKFEEFTTLI